MMFKVIFFVFTFLTYTESAKILGIFPFPGISHYILASKLMKGLAEAGHEVTVVSPYALKDPPKNGKYIDVVLDGFEEEFQKQIGSMNMFEFDTGNPAQRIIMRVNMFLGTVNGTFHHPKMKQIVDSKQKFDAVIMEHFMNDAQKIYAHIFGCPLIILSTVGPNVWVNPTVGNPQPISYVPHFFLGDASTNLSFVKRTKNLMCYMMSYFLQSYYMFPKYQKIIDEIYPNTPKMLEIYTNVSLVLLNSHTSIYPALPLVPNMIEIGGYFIDPPKKLPDDLRKFMDSAKDGVVYFSMGSALKSKDMPKERKQAILNVFGKLKQKVIWKFEEDLPEKPPNVLIKQWCPQQDILAHPNMKLFITHGGLLSTTETVYHGVPILAIPVFADQPMNAARAVEGGYGLELAYNDPDFTEERLSYLVNELLTNPKYRKTAQEKSKFYHDRPMKPMDTAVYWVEYIIRHKGAPHLRVAGVKLPWYKYFMVDVILTIVCTLLLGLYLTKIAIKRLICRICKSKTPKKQKTH